MTVEYNGKRPNKLWYAAVKTAAVITSIKDKNAGKDGLKFLKNTGISLGSLYLGFYVVAPLVASVTLAPIVVTMAASAVAFHFALNKAWPDFGRVRDSGYCYNFVDKAERRWLKRQMQPSLGERIKQKFSFGKKKDQKAAQPEAPFQVGNVFGDNDVKKPFNGSSGKTPPQGPKGNQPPTNDFTL